MANIVHRIGIRAPLKKVYDALSTMEGLSSWWTEDTKGDPSENGKITFTFKTKSGDTLGAFVMKVVKLEVAKQVKWKCEVGPEEWIGTDIVFEISEQDGMTILLFGHRNWREEVEATYHCSMKWAVFLLSLRYFVEKGRGQPSPNDIKIDNWN
jgi:uncharacterized protein YndB with AHSA1/START domain